jgi:hypothetical protein
MYVLYYASMLQCWQLVWILVRTNHPRLGVGCHTPSALISVSSPWALFCFSATFSGPSSALSDLDYP